MSGPSSCPVCGDPAPRPLETAWDVPLWKCGSCGSAFVWPRPEEDDLRARYREEHGRGKWESFFETVPRQLLEEREERVRRLAGGPGRALDVGCGDGGYLEVCRSRGWWVVGTELDRGLAGRARAQSGAPVVTGYLDAVRESATFDAVTFWDVLEHVPDPLALLTEARRRLAPAGVVVATMPNAGGITAFLHGGRWKYFDWDAYGHTHHLSVKGLETLFLRAGLEVIETRTSGSADLRDVPRVRWGRDPGPILTGVLDRVSGLLARLALPLRLGNTLLVAGRRPDE